MTDAAQTATAETAAPAPEKAPKIQQNDVTRPKVGTKTARIWEIADAKSAEAGKPAKRKDVLDAANAEGINVATAATQYGRWRKFNGLKGTDEVETPAAPAGGEAGGDAGTQPPSDVSTEEDGTS